MIFYFWEHFSAKVFSHEDLKLLCIEFLRTKNYNAFKTLMMDPQSIVIVKALPFMKKVDFLGELVDFSLEQRPCSPLSGGNGGGGAPIRQLMPPA